MSHLTLSLAATLAPSPPLIYNTAPIPSKRPTPAAKRQKTQKHKVVKFYWDLPRDLDE